MNAPQRGQAIVAVMVVMLILFALAGAVAIGAESLLGRRNTTSPTTDDFRMHSAVNDSVAQVAGSAHACGAAPAPSPLPTPTPSPIPVSLPLALPSPDSQAQLTALCVRMDSVAADHISRVPSSGTTCRTVNLRVPGPARVAVLFDVHVPQGGGWAYVDGRSGGSPLGTCGSVLPSAAPDSSPCSTTMDTAGWTQVALTCDIPSTQTAQLHIKATQTSPAQVIVAQQSPPGVSPLGSVYLLQVPTPIGKDPLEETLLFVGGDSGSRLLYEAPLQS